MNENTLLRSKLKNIYFSTLPDTLKPWFPRLSQTFYDGEWMSRWPFISAFAPLLFFILGVFSPYIFSNITNVYSESIMFLIVIIVASIINGQWGTMMFLGYVFMDLFGGISLRVYGYNEFNFQLLMNFGSRIINYSLLAFPVVFIPYLSKNWANQLSTQFKSEFKPNAIPVLKTIVAGLFIYLWCQGMIFLIRPVFTWHGTTPSVPAISNFQTKWELLTIIGMVAMILRHFWEKSIKDDNNIDIKTENEQSVFDLFAGGYLKTLGIGLFITLILSGGYEKWFDPLIVFFAYLLISFIKQKRFVLPINKLHEKVPYPILFIITLVFAYIISYYLLVFTWKYNSLRPVMLSALITFLLISLIKPQKEKRNNNET